MKKLLLLPFLFASCCAWSSFPITDGGRPLAEIVIGNAAPAPVANAASELQLWVNKISGARLPIVKLGGALPRQIILSCSPAVLAQFPEDAAALHGNDGYAVRQKNKGLYILATVPHGIVNAVFRVLYRNTDIIWAFPDDENGTFYSLNPSLSFQADGLDIPKMTQRGWQLGRARPNEFMWCVRQANNWTTHSASGVSPLNDEWDMIKECLGGHNLNTVFISEKKYYATRPDFFPLINGERVKPSAKRHRTQLCFTNRDMIAAFKQEFDAQVKRHPTATIYRVMIEDNHDQCQCEACQADILLPDGSTLTNKDPRFYSTRFFLFLNEIAEHAKANHPGKDLLSFAYFFTEMPPAIKVDPIIRVQFCPIFKNSRFDITAPENKATLDKFSAWLANTSNLTWREYYGLVFDFPRPVDAIAAADFRYCLEHGVKRHFAEMENYDVKRKQRLYGRGPVSWDCNAMYFWVMANLQWDPYQDVKVMRRDFLDRVFKEAADDLEKYFTLIEKKWQSGSTKLRWSTPAKAQWFEVTLNDHSVVDSLEGHLRQAEQKVHGSKAQDLLRRIRISFDLYKNRGRIPPMNIPRCDGEPPFDPDLVASPWTDALTIKDFYHEDGRLFNSQPLLLKYLHDGENIYVGFKSTNPGIVKKVNPKYRHGQLEALQLFFQVTKDKAVKPGQGNYNATAITLTNGTEIPNYTSPLRITRKVRETADGWSMWAKIAIRDTGFEPGTGNIRGLYSFRFWTGKNPNQWYDGKAGPKDAIYHVPVCFADMILQ
jgi:hypothetical protein